MGQPTAFQSTQAQLQFVLRKYSWRGREAFPWALDGVSPKQVFGHKSCCARDEHPIIHVTGTVVYSLGYYYYYLVYVCDVQGSGQEPFVPGAKGITGPFPFGQTYS